MDPVRLLAIARKEWIQLRRDTRSVILAFVLPLFLLLFFGYAITWDVNDIPVAVLDEDRTRESRELVEAFVASGYFTVEEHIVVSREVDDRLVMGSVAGVITIPPGFASSLSSPGRAAEVQLLLDGSDANTATIALNYADAIVARHGARAVLEGRAAQPAISLESRTWYNPNLESRHMIVPGLIAVIMSIIAAMLTALTIAREWERGTMEQLAATPVSRLEVVLGKLLPYLAIGLFDVAVTVTAGMIIFGTPLNGSVFLLGVLTLLFLTGALGPGDLHLRRGEVASPRHADRDGFHVSAGRASVGLHVRHRQHADRAKGRHLPHSGSVLRDRHARDLPQGRRRDRPLAAGDPDAALRGHRPRARDACVQEGAGRMSAESRRLSLLRIRRMVIKELRQLFRDERTKRVIFISPIIQLILFGYAVNTDVHDVATALVDHDRTTESRELVSALTASGYFRIVQSSDRSADLGVALDHGRAVVALEIPDGYAADILARRTPAVQLLVDGTNSNTATVAQGYAARIVQQLGARIAQSGGPGTLTPGTAGVTAPPIDLRARAWFNPSLASRVYNVPAVIGVIVLLMCLLLTALAVVREREVGTLEQLLVSPLSAGELMLGKTLPVAGIALVQLTLVTSVALLWFDIPLRGSVPTLLLAAALFILAGLSFGLLISTVSSTQQEAFLAMFLFILPAIILSGFLYPISTMPEFFQELTLINPLRHFLEIVRGIFLKGAGIRELWIQFSVLTAMAATGLAVATRRFRRTL